MTKTRSYPRLGIQEFGTHLLQHNDLDPIYVALDAMIPAGWSPSRVHRWLWAYWCFYHAGSACYISQFEGAEFWSVMKVAAVNEALAPTGGRWPRGSERRHARGSQGVAMVCELAEKFPSPDEALHLLVPPYASGTKVPFAAVSERFRALRGFGPWITFKVGDMLERILAVPVDFSQAEVFMFDQPREAALALWRKEMKLPEGAQPKDLAATLDHVVLHVQAKFKDFKAPPRGDRPLGLQEIETILCKHRSHLSGSYPPFNDIDEINHGLEEWAPKCGAVAQFLASMPRRPNA